MSAEVLRRAAALIRQRAEAATPGPWWTNRNEAEMVWHGDEKLTYQMDEQPTAFTDAQWDAWSVSTGQLLYGDVRESSDAQHIASWHPVVALAVADWLEQHAQYHNPKAQIQCSRGAECRSLAVARAYSGESS